MSKRKLKRKMVRELGIEKFSDIVKRKLKSKNIKDLPNGGVYLDVDSLNDEDINTLKKELNEKTSSRDIRPDKA